MDASPLYFPVTFWWEDGSCSIWEIEAVGIAQESVGNFIKSNADDGQPEGYCTIYLSRDQLLDESKKMANVKHIAFIASSQPEKVMSYGRALGLVAQGIAEVQAQARTAIASALESKALTAAVMLVLLAINLYSSFSNVLQTRCFEIGVKRAIGASKGSIVRQFLYEAMLVLGFDAIVAAALVADALIIYKFIQGYFYGINWIAYVSPYSMAIYGCCCMVLTLAFSLMFGFGATQVEIVGHLKSE